MLAYRWTSPQHIKVLEMTAILAELRRRSRSTKHFHTRYINVIDSMVAYWATTKGRSSSVRMNRTLRRMMAVELAANLRHLLVWTLGTSRTRLLASLRRPRAEMAPKLHLKFKGITSKTARLYRQEVNRFSNYVSSNFGSLPRNVIELDDCMAEFINMLYQEGESVSHPDGSSVD